MLTTSIQSLSEWEAYYVSASGFSYAHAKKITALTTITIGSIAISFAADGMGGLFLSGVTSMISGIITAIGTDIESSLSLPVASPVAGAASGVAIYYLYKYLFPSS